MENKLGKQVWIGFYIMFGSALAVLIRNTFMETFPEMRENGFWIIAYLAFIVGGLLHYEKDSARVKITILFMVLPIALMFLLSWVFRDAEGLYSPLLKINFPRSVLTASVIWFLYYALYLNPSERRLQVLENKRKKNGGGEGVNKKS